MNDSISSSNQTLHESKFTHIKYLELRVPISLLNIADYMAVFYIRFSSISQATNVLYYYELCFSQSEMFVLHLSAGCDVLCGL